MSESNNLWPDFKADKIISPKTLMKEQAGFLSEKTKNLLVGEIGSSGDGGGFTHFFYVVAPALKNYRFRLFYVRHDILYYPLTVVSSNKRTCQSEEEFKALMTEIFNNPDTIKMISSLMAQSIEE